MSERVYEVWVDADRFIGRFTYPERRPKDAAPKVAPGTHALASHCHYGLCELPLNPFTWPESGRASAKYVAKQVSREFPGAHVRSFDGVTRRRLR